MIGTVIRIAVVLALVLGVYWTFLFFVQRRLLFPAPSIVGAPARPPDARQVWLPGRRGETEAWFLPPLAGDTPPAPLLLFGHGNGELIDYWPNAFAEPRHWGMAVLLVEYPGYGRSAGQPSEETIRETFRAAYDWAVTEAAVDPDRIVGYGRSLGGGGVGLLSRERRLVAMIFESSFASTRPFARGFGAPGFLVRDPFDNESAVRAFKGPLLIIHGSDDRIIPVQHGRRLAEAGNVPLHALPCGHNDCPRSWPLIKDFLVDQHILRTRAVEQ
jgi:pimeloyl-ACP methyl ester carboxylesterase